FIMTLNAEQLAFVESLNGYLVDSGCKAIFEEKKSGMLASYKHGKTKKALINFLFRKNGLKVRIYGENLDNYRDFLNTLPAQMVEEIDGASACKRLVSDGCSPKCIGYDFNIDTKHFQKCRYNCFEFLLTNETAPYIKTFIEKELTARG
ncbi:MAG: hypothetical protein FWC82_04085, partial [Firmicutes bacterium]|nr:hypothetical protein [Bacillota bacterium]